MKKKIYLILAIAMVACLLLPTLVACNSSEGSTGAMDRLVVYNWEDYMDKYLRDEFCEYYKEVTGRSIEIVYTTFDTNETMMTKVLKNDAPVDLICPSEYAIEKLMLAGCLENQFDIYTEIAPQLEEYGLSLTNMSSLKKGYGNLESEVIDVIGNMFGAIEDESGSNVYDMTEYMVPYMWGTLGILYNKNIVTRQELEQHGWGVLWNVQNNRKLENKILMKDSVRDSYAAAVFYMYENTVNNRTVHTLPDGISPTYNLPFTELTVQQLINCTDKEMLNAAEKVLTEQRDHISGYEVDFGKDDMLNQIVYADFAWSGDALWAIDESYNKKTDTYLLDYYVPPVASNIWYDGWVIPTSVKNKLAAMMFIEYMCRPMSGIRNSMEIGYTSAVAKDILADDGDVAEFLIDNLYRDEEDPEFEYDEDEALECVEDYFADERRYPVIDDTLGVMRDFGKDNETLVQMWQRAKSGAGVENSLWWIILVIVLAIGLALGVYFCIQALKFRPRKIRSASESIADNNK